MSIDKIKRSSVYIKQLYNGSFMLYFRTIDDRNIFMKLFNNKNTYNFYTKYSLPLDLYNFKYLYCKKSKLYIPNTILGVDDLTYRDIKMKYQYCVLILYDTKMEHSLRFVIFSILKELKTMKLLLDIQTYCTTSIRICLFNRILNER